MEEGDGKESIRFFATSILQQCPVSPWVKWGPLSSKWKGFGHAQNIISDQSHKGSSLSEWRYQYSRITPCVFNIILYFYFLPSSIKSHKTNSSSPISLSFPSLGWFPEVLTSITWGQIWQLPFCRWTLKAGYWSWGAEPHCCSGGMVSHPPFVAQSPSALAWCQWSPCTATLEITWQCSQWWSAQCG